MARPKARLSDEDARVEAASAVEGGMLDAATVAGPVRYWPGWAQTMIAGVHPVVAVQDAMDPDRHRTAAAYIRRMTPQQLARLQAEGGREPLSPEAQEEFDWQVDCWFQLYEAMVTKVLAAAPDPGDLTTDELMSLHPDDWPRWAAMGRPDPSTADVYIDQMLRAGR